MVVGRHASTGALAVFLCGAPAFGASTESEDGRTAARPPADADARHETHRFEASIPVRDAYHLLAGISVGRGMRFNNPYRLETELGENAESLSLTATYFDLNVGATIGGEGPISHGVVLHGSFALGGIPQEVVTPSYLLLIRPSPRWGVAARAGVPIVVEPDLNAGFEVAGTAMLYLTASLGLTASVVGSLFYGAATLDVSRTTIPILSAEAGAFWEYEVLP